MALKTVIALEARTCVAHGAFTFNCRERKTCSMPSWSSFTALQSCSSSSTLHAAKHTTNKSTRRSSPSARHHVAAMLTDSSQPQDSEIVRKPKILVAEKLDDVGLERLKSVADVDCSYDLSQEELCAKISVYDALVVMSGTRVTREVFKASKGTLKVVGSAGLVGLDNVDVQAATEVGCLVVNASTVNTRAAAEQGIDLLTVLSQNVPRENSTWKVTNNSNSGVSLAGKIVAVMGFGQVGSEVARRAKRLGMVVIVHDPYVSPHVARELDLELVSFDEALARADFISLHMAVTPTMEKLFNDETFAKVKKGVRIANMATRGVIDEEALLRALDMGLVGQAALGVGTVGHPEKLSMVIQHEKVLVAPHLGFSASEAEEGVAVEIADAVIGALWGELTATAMWTRLYSELDLLQDLGYI